MISGVSDTVHWNTESEAVPTLSIEKVQRDLEKGLQEQHEAVMKGLELSTQQMERLEALITKQ